MHGLLVHASFGQLGCDGDATARDAQVASPVDAGDGDASHESGDGDASQDPGRDSAAPPDGDAAAPGAMVLPPLNAGLDYQLGGAYPVPDGVGIVSRDRTEAPAAGLYNICYVNGFQVQPGDEPWWMAEHPSLLLRDAGGGLVIDRDWDEILIDVTTPTKRAEVAAVVGDWIAGCAADGFDAIEIDNLDSYSRSRGLITEDDGVAQMRLFSDAAHALGLAIAQKNSAEIVGRRDELATDFVVAEECNRYRECDVYTGVYGEHVLVIEYRRGDFDRGCVAYPALSIVLRDLNLVTPEAPAYVYDGC